MREQNKATYDGLEAASRSSCIETTWKLRALSSMLRRPTKARRRVHSRARSANWRSQHRAEAGNLRATHVIGEVGFTTSARASDSEPLSAASTGDSLSLMPERFARRERGPNDRAALVP